MSDIARVVGLDMRDLFPPRDRKQLRERDIQRHRFEAAPRKTLAQALGVELARVRDQLRAEHGYVRPLRSADHNEARQRVARSFGITEKPALVPPFIWECPPHDDDPEWPTLFVHALEEETRRRWHALFPKAEAWETDPSGPTIFDRFRAEMLAREWLRELSR